MRPPELRDKIQEIFSKVPAACSDVRLYPAGLNICECYLLAEAIKQKFQPEFQMNARVRHKNLLVTVQEINVDFIYDMCLNDHGGGSELSAGELLFFSLESEDTFALLAGSQDLVRLAIPFPDDIWADYFKQIMWATEPHAYEMVLNQFNAWMKSRT